MGPSKNIPTVIEPFAETPGPRDGGNGTSHPHASAGVTEADEDRPFHGVHVLRIPRPVVGHVTGTLQLSELPRRKPTIVFDGGRRFRVKESGCPRR